MIDFIHGDLEKTIEHYSLALENFQQLEMNFDAVEILNDLGESYRLLGSLDTALVLFEWGYQLAKDINFRSTLPYFANNIGQIYRVRGIFPKR